MNRREALEQLLAGNKVVSYFGQEYELTKHGLSINDQGRWEHLPMSDSCQYTVQHQDNPHEVGTMDWARWLFEHGHTVRTPDGSCLDPDIPWEVYRIMISDISAKTWECVPPPLPPSTPTPSVSDDTDQEP